MRLFPVSLKRFVLKRKIRTALFYLTFLLVFLWWCSISPRIHKIFQSGLLKEEKKLRWILFYVLLEKSSRFLASNFLFTLEKCLFFSGSYIGHNKHTSITIKRYGICRFLITQLFRILGNQFLLEWQLLFHTRMPLQMLPRYH